MNDFLLVKHAYYIFSRNDEELYVKSKEQGFTLIELLTVLSIVGILSVIAVPIIRWINNPLQNATYQVSGLLSQARSRAIAVSSALRIRPDPQDPKRLLLVETSDTRSCDTSSTELAANATTTSQELKVVSVQGFAPGDYLTIGSDENENIVLTTDSRLSTITLGKPLGTVQNSGAEIGILKTWRNDRTFFDEDLEFSDNIAMKSNLGDDWELCFDSRGIATISDSDGVSKEDLEITLVNEKNNNVWKVIVFQGGMIDSVIVQVSEGKIIESSPDLPSNPPENNEEETPIEVSTEENNDVASEAELEVEIDQGIMTIDVVTDGANSQNQASSCKGLTGQERSQCESDGANSQNQAGNQASSCNALTGQQKEICLGVN
ncbi:prepilin-type N-terminal cleavage/methylation domain-containing protein [Synechococcus sp. BDU 130192]|uniref:prepilin-type N-terminal cleavage/methylation domain-containing protein n=1 Tax=Synechococcus sp. BDU 130192 TaxID=2042059 RepID=UPI000C06E63D|nr:prepilin-type N-terminal cleavage/methylation domain-containing protein [Synechococcus sp. BDU 130192]